MSEQELWQCTVCRRVGTVGRCCGKETRRPVEEVPCPDCYGGHFRPCQLCGNSGRAIRIREHETKGGAEDLGAEVAALRVRLNEARDTNAHLNRRAQQAEAAAAEWREVAAMTKEQRTGRFFPALAALSLSKAWEENDQLQALVAEILATLRVNLERGRLTSEDDADLERIMEAWAKRAKGGAKCPHDSVTTQTFATGEIKPGTVIRFGGAR